MDGIDLGGTNNPKAKPSDFMFLKVIGKGSFGKVSKASELLVGYLQMPVMPVIVTGSQSLSQPASQLAS